MPRAKASTEVGPALVFRIYGTYYTSDVQAAKQLADYLARRVAYMLIKVNGKCVADGTMTWAESEERLKRLKKRAYPRCKFYVQRWLKK